MDPRVKPEGDAQHLLSRTGGKKETLGAGVGGGQTPPVTPLKNGVQRAVSTAQEISGWCNSNNFPAQRLAPLDCRLSPQWRFAHRPGQSAGTWLANPTRPRIRSGAVRSLFFVIARSASDEAIQFNE